MREDKAYQNFFAIEKVFCCQEIPIPLYHIPVKITKGRNHASHYFDYAFECIKCGAVYEVEIEDYSYESIGDLMQSNYTSWSTRPSLVFLENHPTLKQELVTAKKEWFEQVEILDEIIWGLKDKIDKKVDKLKKITGRLDKEQIHKSQQKLGKIELLAIGEYRHRQENLLRVYVGTIRTIVGLPTLDNPNRKKDTSKQIQLFTLRKELDTKQRQLSCLDVTFASIEAQNKLLVEVDEIEKKIKNLSQ